MRDGKIDPGAAADLAAARAASERGSDVGWKSRAEAAEKAAAESERKLREALLQIEAFKIEHEKLKPRIEELAARAADAEAAERESRKREASGGRKSAKEVAALLGLDPARQAAFASEFDRISSELNALEKRNAKVTRDGENLTIEIPAFVDEGAAVAKQWADWREKHLSSEERTRYDGSEFESSLFRTPPGVANRSIKFSPAEGGGWRLEDVSHWDGSAMKMVDDGDNRQRMLEPYGYLLN
jgi:hypothetical protein